MIPSLPPASNEAASLAWLLRILALPTQRKVQEFVREALTAMNRPFTEDAKGNLISDPTPSVTKAWLVGHMDTVHREHRDNTSLEIKAHGDWLSAFWSRADFKGPYEQTGIGGDDKCGVWACLEAAAREFEGGPPVGLAFVVEEEVGCLGSKHLLKHTPEVLASANCFIQLDRRGHADAIQFTNGIDIWTDEFRALLAAPMKTFGFAPANGTLTDIGECSRVTRKPSINISSGYHNAHSDQETVNWKQALNSLAFAFAIVDAAGSQDLGALKEPAGAKSYSPSYGGSGIGNYGGARISRTWDLYPGEFYKAPAAVSTPRIEDLVRDAVEAVAEGLGYSAKSSLVRATLSPIGVAVYRHLEEGTYMVPPADNMDATGHHKEHASLVYPVGDYECLPQDERLVTFTVTVAGDTEQDFEYTMSGLSGATIDPVGEMIDCVADTGVIPSAGRCPVIEDKLRDRFAKFPEDAHIRILEITNAPVLPGSKRLRNFNAYEEDFDGEVSDGTALSIEVSCDAATRFYKILPYPSAEKLEAILDVTAKAIGRCVTGATLK